MSSEDIGWAFLYLVVVALIIVVGVVVGMIVAGRIDRLMTPRPPKPADTSPTGEPASAGQQSAPDQEEQP